MRQSIFGLVLWVSTQHFLPAQVETMGPGITPPKAVYAPEPEYTEEALINGIQGTVKLAIVVDEHGKATDITPISSLGFGLDERAVATIESWKFNPGTKDGKAVKIEATVEMTFRLQGQPFDEKAERERTAYNAAIHILKNADAPPKQVEAAVGSLRKLAADHQGAAMYVLGNLEIQGLYVNKDEAAGLQLIEKSAETNYTPALYQMAILQIAGKGVARDTAKGLENLHKAASNGSLEAQQNLGERYEAGSGVQTDASKAIRYFGLCAAHGSAACQFQLGKLLLMEQHAGSVSLRAIAWLQLAAAQGVTEASRLASAEIDHLTAAQLESLKSLEAQLAHK